jgi:hypothetical protein
MASLLLSHKDYTVAWICALLLEIAAAKAVLDEIHSPFQQPPTDHNTYTFGRLSGIMWQPPACHQVFTSATTVLAHMLPTCPPLRFCLMVGIGSGVLMLTFDSAMWWSAS